MPIIFRSCTFHHIRGSLILHKDLTVLVEYLKKAMYVFCIAMNNLLARYIKIIHLYLTREQIDELLQLLPGIRRSVLLDFYDFYGELLEDELADVEIGAIVYQHVLIDEARITRVCADIFHQLDEVGEADLIVVHHTAVRIDLVIKLFLYKMGIK